MTVRAIPGLPQDDFLYTAALSSANGGTLIAPTNTSLLMVAGPDGSEIWGASATPNATGATANRADLFISTDGGSTFTLFGLSALMAAFTLSTTAALVTVNFGAPNGIPLAPGNPIPVGGKPKLMNHVMAQNALSESPLYFKGADAEGTNNALICPYAVNSAGAELGASPAYGTILDCTIGPGLSNTGAATLQAGLQAAGVNILRKSGTNLSSGDVQAPFLYRFWWDTVAWRLMLTPRIYAALSVAQGVTLSMWGRHL